MGARGRHAHVTNRAQHKNRMPNARYRDEVVEGNAAWWDLCVGGGRHWADPLDRRRAAAWREWRARIFARWPRYRTYGARPDAWDCFDLPRLIARAEKAGTLTAAEVKRMDAIELVHRLDADATERAEIEEQWSADVENALGLDHPRTPAEHRIAAVKTWSVPAWFFDKRQQEK